MESVYSEKMGNRKLHAIMIGFCYQGHITPFINLAMKLASNGCTVTFVNPEFIHNLLSKAHDQGEVDPFHGARESGLDIRYTTISDGLPLDFDRILYFEEHWDALYRDFPSRVDELVGNIIIQSSDFVHFLVADTFYSWPATIAQKYNIFNVSFWTEPALVFLIYYHLDLLRENGYFPIKGDYKEHLIDFIPGVDPIKAKDLMSYLHDLDVTSTTSKIVVDAFEQVKYADFILINTLNDNRFERQSVLAMNQKQPTYAIGPINFTTDFTESTVPKSLWFETDCTEWLNSKPPGSVLYVSFGSIAQSNRQVAEEMANGLLLSEVNFVWVIRDSADVLPDGFKNDSKDQGLIVSWCNQNAVISNPAIGGFLTHCGWNSILESIWCGVPMICYPFFADQPTNRKLVVDDWKIGINLCDAAAASSVDRKEVAEKIKVVMSDELSIGLRDEMKKMRKVMHEQLDEDGSAQINFRQFLKDLCSRADALTFNY